MIDSLTLISLVLGILGVCSAIFSFYQIHEKRNAEKNLIHKLSLNYNISSQRMKDSTTNSEHPVTYFEDKYLTTINELVYDRDKLRNKSLNLDKLTNARKFINILASNYLDESDKKLITEGLSQPSERGQANYIVKLLDRMEPLVLKGYLDALFTLLETGDVNEKAFALDSIREMQAFIFGGKEALQDMDNFIEQHDLKKVSIIPGQEISQQNLLNYLNKHFANKIHAKTEYMLEIINDLSKEGFNQIQDIDKLIADYPPEKYIPKIESETGSEMSDIGIIRSLLVAKKIDEIRSVIESWIPLPPEPKDLRDPIPFVDVGSGIASYLMKSEDNIKIHTTNAGDLEITFDELGNRIGTGLPYLRRLKERLDPFHTYLLSEVTKKTQVTHT